MGSLIEAIPDEALSDNKAPTNVTSNLVEWEPNESQNPRNFPLIRKCFITAQLSFLAFSASLGSSIFSQANSTIVEYLGVTTEAGVLTVSLYILGFAIGPLIWASVSEVWGRRWSILPAFFLLGIFSIATSVCRNAPSLFMMRFLAGTFGSAPASNGAAALSDIWHQNPRGIAFMFFSLSVIAGPTLGPTVGAVILTHLGWRWIGYIEATLVLVIFGICFFNLPEVYSPVLLARKAKRRRAETGNSDLFHPHEHLKLDFKSIVSKQLSRPLAMLLMEPMVTLIVLYASFVYGLLFMTLEVFPIVFEEGRGWDVVIGSLPFLALLFGVCLSLLILYSAQNSYIKRSIEANGNPVPEARLPPMAVGGVIIVIGIFWFAWTAAERYHWSLSVIASVLIGCGFQVIFSQCVNFLVDTYGQYAASAVAANTFFRSLLAFSFPLVARPMFHGLGVGPAMSIMGGIAVLLLPVPFLFMRYSLFLRKKSRFAPIDP